ncbi:MAG: hypothetical protein DMF42_09420 [Verrucomicrobia bacterium]|nr:MAG: hypothetical protein DMF42_09420 [Verrucomicrobiota bacterium]
MQCWRAELSIGNLSDRRFVARGPGWLGPRAAYFERTIAFESTEPNDLNGAARPSEHSAASAQRPVCGRLAAD